LSGKPSGKKRQFQKFNGRQGFPKTKSISSHFVSSRLNYSNRLLLVACTGSFVV